MSETTYKILVKCRVYREDDRLMLEFINYGQQGSTAIIAVSEYVTYGLVTQLTNLLETALESQCTQVLADFYLTVGDNLYYRIETKPIPRVLNDYSIRYHGHNLLQWW